MMVRAILAMPVMIVVLVWLLLVVYALWLGRGED